MALSAGLSRNAFSFATHFQVWEAPLWPFLFIVVPSQKDFYLPGGRADWWLCLAVSAARQLLEDGAGSARRAWPAPVLARWNPSIRICQATCAVSFRSFSGFLVFLDNLQFRKQIYAIFVRLLSQTAAQLIELPALVVMTGHLVS